MNIDTSQEASSSTSLRIYDIFLSFRGKDTRNGFTSHLYTALVQAGFYTYRDDDEIERGERVDLELQKAIEQSRISVIVISTNYASSKWCLDELVKILECNKTSGLKVLPIFFKVNPSQVRKQTGSFAEAFEKHEKQYEAVEVEKWRAALEEVAVLAGETFKKQEKGNESEFIQKLVRIIGKKLNRAILYVPPYLVGMDSRVRDINVWLQDKSSQTRIAIIYGVGGIGKTTIAKMVYNQNSGNFDGSCSFLESIRQASMQFKGFTRLQKQLISDISKRKKEDLYGFAAGIMRVRDAICHKPILVVFDDVDHEEQIDAIVGEKISFYPGSKIIITTRHEQLLKAHEACLKFKIKELNNAESLQLFCWHAFGQEHPTECFVELAENFVKHCGGIPLALRVLGSSLSGQEVDEWESALKKLKMCFNIKIFDVLKISYDSIRDKHEQNLFLDVAFFFVGKERTVTIDILDECGYATRTGIRELLKRCLITINEKDKLMMHQLLEDMCREIVRQESPEPQRRSRLWHNDALTVLRDKTGTENIYGLALNSNEYKQDRPKETFSTADEKEQQSKDVLDKSASTMRNFLGFVSWFPLHYSPSKHSFSTSILADFEISAFSRMSNMKLLQINHTRITGGYEDFPKNVRFLSWRGFSENSIPVKFHMENLVALDMRNSSLKQFREKSMVLRALKILNLSHSYGLVSTPNFTQLPNLERLILKYCINLVEVHESIGDLEQLTVLNLKDCRNLTKLPSRLAQLKSLKVLILSGCSKLNEFPEDIEEMESLKEFYADAIAIHQSFSTSIVLKYFFRVSLRSLQSLAWSWVLPTRSQKSAASFSVKILPRALKRLDLADCNLKDSAIPILIERLSSLEDLNLKGNPLSRLPKKIKGHRNLKSLILDNCPIQFLPELPSSLERLHVESCTALKKITNLPNLLTVLDLVLRDCSKLVEVQNLFMLVPISDFNTEVLSNLGIHDLEAVKIIKVELRNAMSSTSMKVSVKGLYEFGIFSTSLPVNTKSGWLNGESTSSEMESNFYEEEKERLDLVVPFLGNGKIRGITICITYQELMGDSLDCLDIYIHNKTKNIKWRYTPTFFGIPSRNEDIMWLSHWRFGNDLEVGDQMEIEFEVNSEIEKMKKCEVRVLFENDAPLQESNVHPPFENVIYGNLSAYDLMNKKYLLCHTGFITHQEFYTMKPEWWLREKSFYNCLFRDHDDWPRSLAWHYEIPGTRGAEIQKTRETRGLELRRKKELALFLLASQRQNEQQGYQTQVSLQIEEGEEEQEEADNEEGCNEATSEEEQDQTTEGEGEEEEEEEEEEEVEETVMTEEIEEEEDED